MLFVTTLLICSFCFVVFLIWNQFLKKDANLHVGLKVLRNKMSLLETFSQKTDQQLRQGIELLDQKNQNLEKIVKEARFCIFKMEKLIHNFENMKDESISQSTISLVPEAEQKLTLVEKEESKEIVQPEKDKKSKFQFGESPFSHLSFVEHPATQKKDPDEEPPSPQP